MGQQISSARLSFLSPAAADSPGEPFLQAAPRPATPRRSRKTLNLGCFDADGAGDEPGCCSQSRMSADEPTRCTRNESDSGLSNACASTSSNRSDDDAQNGNECESDGVRRYVKSSSIDRYMSAITDRVERTQIAECECKTRTYKKVTCCKKTNPKVRKSDTAECLSCSDSDRDKNVSKTKRWVSKFYNSKSSKNAKISGAGVNRSTDSGLDVAGSSSDPNCVCTLYRKVDPCRTEPTAPVRVGISEWQINGRREESAADDGAEACGAFSGLPFNITVTRVALGGDAQGSNRVYHTIRSNGVYSDLNGVISSFQNNGNSIQLVSDEGSRQNGENVILLSVGSQSTPVIDIRWGADQDCEERARVRRALEIFRGVDPPPGYRPSPHIQITQERISGVHTVVNASNPRLLFLQQQVPVEQPVLPPRIHTQVDFIHCLVPDLRAINNCSFYWGKMDRYEAERLLEAKTEGTFLLRDSAQEEYLFSVSFRKYGRSLHARIEQFNHKFSFDSHDPGVYAAATVTGLIEHYKDPACVMFFEPMLTAPLSRTHAFPLQHLCRAVVASCITYDGINELRLPQALKSYLKEYHYRQRVCVKRFDGPQNITLDGDDRQ